MSSTGAIFAILGVFALVFVYGMVMYHKGVADAVEKYENHLRYIQQLERELESEIYNRHNGGE